MSSDEMVSSSVTMLSPARVSSCASSHPGQLVPSHVEPPPDAAVEHLVPDPGDHAADHGRVDQHLEVHVLAGGPGERLGKPVALPLVERDGGAHLGELRVPAL